LRREGWKTEVRRPKRGGIFFAFSANPPAGGLCSLWLKNGMMEKWKIGRMDNFSASA